MWCPQCESEYRPGFTHCSDCGVDLVDERPPPPPPPDDAVLAGLVTDVVSFAVTPLALAFALLGTAWSIAVYLPVLFADHCGLHDIAAGTVVLLDR